MPSMMLLITESSKNSAFKFEEGLVIPVILTEASEMGKK